MSTVNARAFSAAQDFLLGAKKFWTTQMYPQLREQNQAHTTRTASPVEERVQGNDLYPFYAWMERHLQRMKYAGRYGLPLRLRWPQSMCPPCTTFLCPPITHLLMYTNTRAG